MAGEPERTPDERLFPAKVAAALLSLAGLAGLFVKSLQRGPNENYTYIVGAITAAVALGIAVVLVRRWRQRTR